MRKKNLSHTHDLCLDGKFLPANPVNLMERGEYNHVDLMVGVTKVYFFGEGGG